MAQEESDAVPLHPYRDNEPHDGQDNITTRAPKRRRVCPWWLIHTVFVLFYAIIFIIGLNNAYMWGEGRCIRILSAHSPALEAVRYENVVLDARVNGAKSIYKEAPSPEVDKAWDDISDIEGFILSGDDMGKLGGAGNGIVRVEDGYYANLEVHHQLHCLNQLRQSIYPEYYRRNDTETSRRGDRGHLNHCVDYLRQVLMCHGDVTVETHHWVRMNGTNVPLADFMTTHKCRDFQRIMDWSNAHKGDWSMQEVNRWLRPGDVVLDQES